MTAKKTRMGGMSLGSFSKTPQSSPPNEQSDPNPNKVLDDKPIKATSSKQKPKPSKLVSVNIKVDKQQQDWLRDTAQQVRDNNSDPVPANERVYPQHLIGVAIELLKSADIDWSQIKSAEQLKDHLNL